MEQTRIYRALQGTRGRAPVDLAGLEQLLVRFGQLVAEQRWIKEIDVNPLFVSPTSIPESAQSRRGMLALDAHIVLHDRATRLEDIPGPLMRPYPMQYVTPWVTTKGMPVTLRPIRPEDEPLIAAFHSTLSERSVSLRYLNILSLSQRIAHERLTRICFDDYDHEIALVAERVNPQDQAREIIAVGRISKLRRRNEVEFAILVSDGFQGHGLGTELLSRLIQIARDEKQNRVIGFIAAQNAPMLRVCQRLGFRLHRPLDDAEVQAVLDL
jgi:acetyltransferase